VDSLAVSLQAIDKRLAPEIRKSLRRPATAKAKQALAKLFGGRLPRDLDTWFGWHDGQPTLASGPHPDDPAITLMSISDALAEHKRLNAEPEKMLPWSETWLPIAENGGGDCYVYVMRGKRKGTILFYLHDAKDRSVIAKSLAGYAAQIAKALARPPKPAPPAVVTFGDLIEPLIEIAAPTLADLDAAPIGTVYYQRSLPYQGYAYWISVKVTERWIRVRGKEPSGGGDADFRIDAALVELRDRLAKEFPAEWNARPEDIVFGLSDAAIYPANGIWIGGPPRWPEGLYADDVERWRRDPYFCRRMGRLTAA
jgi:cell wall assembly regulator SMI1